MPVLTVDPYLSSLKEDSVELRHQLHQIPEVGLDLPKTQNRLLQELDGLPLEITLGKKLSSITAVLRGRGVPNGTRKSVLLRGDMDALPVAEDTGLDWASTNGAMHACGHDCHMAILVAAAKSLCHRINDLPGDVVFMFQPGEEADNGASRMIDEGILEAPGRRIDAAFGVHVWAGLDHVGAVYCRPGTILASMDSATIKILGRGGHGSAPHLAKDPVPALAGIVTALQVMVARHFNIFDPVVVTCGHVTAGTARNVIPESALVEATMRAFSLKAQDRLFDLVPKVVEGIAATNGVSAETQLEHIYPATINDPAMAQLVSNVASEIFGCDRFIKMENPMGAAEDFSFILQQVPGAFIILPATPMGEDLSLAQGNHSAHAIYDDSVLITGSVLLAELAMRILTQKTNV